MAALQGSIDGNCKAVASSVCYLGDRVVSHHKGSGVHYAILYLYSYCVYGMRLIQHL